MTDWKSLPMSSFTWPTQIAICVWGLMLIATSFIIASALVAHIPHPYAPWAFFVVYCVVQSRLLK
jgi:hypothetical protein